MNRKKRTGQILLLACILALGSGTWGCAQGTGRQAVSPGQERRYRKNSLLKNRPWNPGPLPLRTGGAG